MLARMLTLNLLVLEEQLRQGVVGGGLQSFGHPAGMQQPRVAARHPEAQRHVGLDKTSPGKAHRRTVQIGKRPAAQAGEAHDDPGADA